MDLREMIAQVEKTFGILGIPVFAAYLVTILMWVLRRRSAGFKERGNGWFDRFRLWPSVRPKPVRCNRWARSRAHAASPW
ncbi:MAG: hypothetical protein LLG08_11145 [Actinomycetia bacterium]|nr:hypothetical protein [Actinomycetes bacterium]